MCKDIKDMVHVIIIIVNAQARGVDSMMPFWRGDISITQRICRSSVSFYNLWHSSVLGSWRYTSTDTIHQ